jgi:hypothetical protein
VIARAIAAVVVKMIPAISSIRMGIGLRVRGKGLLNALIPEIRQELSMPRGDAGHRGLA